MTQSYSLIKSINFWSLVLSLAFLTLSATGCNTTDVKSAYSGEDIFSSSNSLTSPFVDEFSDEPPIQPQNLAFNDVFKIGDTVDINVYNVETLSGEFVVERGGGVSFPLIGLIPVVGHNTSQLRQTLTDEYGEYLQRPNISVKIIPLEVDLGEIVVDGAVQSPGVFKVDRVIRLTEAVAMGGGVTPDASRDEIYLSRIISGRRQVRVVNLGDIRKHETTDPHIYPGDVIFVNESLSRVAFREFLRTVPLLNTVAILGTR